MHNSLMLADLKKSVMYRYLILLVIAGTLGLQGWRTLFNNFAVDQVGISGLQVGGIQSIREIPGFLSLLIVYLLLFVKEYRLSAISILVVGLGITFTGFFPSFWGLVFTTFIFSLGYHYFETTNNSLTLQYFSTKDSPRVLANQQSWKAITNIGIGAFILITAHFVTIKINFLILGLLVITIGVYALFWKPTKKDLPIQNKGIIFHKKYWLFYTLNLLSGARRQIFVVFAVFMFVERFHFTVVNITILFIINNIISYFTAPLIGKAINKYGEHALLTTEYISMIVVFLGYAFVNNVAVITSLYIVDNIFFSCAMGINTFFQKMGDKKDIAPSMAMGFTINHISAVIFPVLGGALWMISFRLPFLMGVGFAITSLILVQFIPKYLAKKQTVNSSLSKN